MQFVCYLVYKLLEFIQLMRKLNTTDINYLKKLFEKYDAERRYNGLLN